METDKYTKLKNSQNQEITNQNNGKMQHETFPQIQVHINSSETNSSSVCKMKSFVQVERLKIACKGWRIGVELDGKEFI